MTSKRNCCTRSTFIFSWVIVIVYDLFLSRLISFDNLGVQCLQATFYLIWDPIVWLSTPSTSQLTPLLSQACEFKMLNHAYWTWWWVASCIVCNQQPRPCQKKFGKGVGRILKKTPRFPRSPRAIPQSEMDPPILVKGSDGVGEAQPEVGGNPSRIQGDQPSLVYLARGGCTILARHRLGISDHVRKWIIFSSGKFSSRVTHVIWFARAIMR